MIETSYISKDTVIAYAHEEDATCEYLEVSEVTESRVSNWTPRQRSNNTESDLIFSPAQVTEQYRVELKDQDISPATRNRFEVLKRNTLRYSH